MAITVKYLHTPPAVTLTGIPTRYKVATSVAGATITNLYINLMIQFFDQPTLTWYDTEYVDKIPVSDGVAEFDISSYFKTLLTPDFTFPEHFTNLAIKHENMSKLFRVQTWDSYDDDGVATTGDVLESSSHYMLRGGISTDDLKAMEDAGTDWWDELQVSQRSLDWMPDEKQTCILSPEKRYWFVWNSGTYNYRIDYVDTDGNSDYITQEVYFASKSMYELCVSPAIVELLTGKQITQYTHSIEGQLAGQTYIVDRTYYDVNELFSFRNSFDTYEMLWCHGASTQENKYERNTYAKRLPFYAGRRDRERITTRATRVQENTSNTGFLNNIDHLRWAEDFVLSDDVWLIDGLKLSPVEVSTEEHTMFDSLSEVPWNGEFEWKISAKGRYNSRFGVTIDKLLPPYWSRVGAFYYKYRDGQLIDLKNGYLADVDTDNNITFPDIAATDVLEFSNSIYWDNTLLPWYDAGNDHTCPVSFLDGTGEFAEAAKDETHGSLFFCDYNGDLRKQKIIFYNSALTSNEQEIVREWLQWYASIFDGSAAVTDNNNIVTQE